MYIATRRSWSEGSWRVVYLIWLTMSHLTLSAGAIIQHDPLLIVQQSKILVKDALSCYPAL
jgi:hypothetical protein